jgi:HEAT repeat protein
MSYLAREIDREYSTDLHRAVLDVLLDIFEVQSSPEVRDEVARHLDALSLHLLTGQQFSNVTHLLNESAHTLSRLPDLSDELRERIERIADRVSDPALLGPLLDSLNKSATPPPLDDLTALFNRLRPRALGTLFIWSEQAKNPAVRTRIAEAADRLALAGTEELVKLIGSPDHREALEAAHRAGVMCVDEAVPALVRMLGHQSDDLRAAALGALSEISTPRAISGIERALDDSSRGIRVAAIKALTTAVHKPALRRVTQAIEERGNREMDTNELRALFELYGLLCGDAGIPLLDEILNGSRGFFKRREDTETRACAAAALGNVNSPAAQESLKRALSEKDPVLRRAVSRALGGRTQ